MDAADCVSSLAIDGILQMQLLQAGALWHLLPFLFEYDYTLEEGGVETEFGKKSTDIFELSNAFANKIMVHTVHQQ